MEAAARAIRPSAVNGVAPSVPYDQRRPSPPFIQIPPHGTMSSGEPMTGLTPAYDRVDTLDITQHEFHIITQGRTQSAIDRSSEWSYPERRIAQRLLDFLYLGPNSVIRDVEWLRAQKISMILVVRDARMKNTALASVEAARKQLEISHTYVDFTGIQHLISMFPIAVRAINEHLLVAANRGERSSGRVLITCETGNERSAAIAAAYIMAMFKVDMITTIQFISVQRFCCCFDEDVKRKLQSWEDLINAKCQVAAQNRSNGTFNSPSNGQKAKRHIDQVVDMDKSSSDPDTEMMDEDRFEGRVAFRPFVNQ